MTSNNTNFNKVREFHDAFGLVVNEKSEDKLFDNEKMIKLRQDLIAEEFAELQSAINDRNMVEVGDALADILYVTYGAGVSLGIDLDKAFRLVHESNMSKLCKSEEEAVKTVKWYLENQSVYDSPAYRVCVTNPNLWVVYNKSSGKILKSINYAPVNLGYLNIVDK